MTIRPLHTIAEFQEVAALEAEIWGYTSFEDAVGLPMFVATLKRGGILLGAYDGDRLIGFVYSIAGMKDGRPTQWSHMLGVRREYRAAGVGRDLKLEQRRVCLGMGVELMEWTYDPLVAVNAHLNLHRLGATAREYAVDAYGASASPLHEGAPTDRFIVEWWMRSPRVDAALGAPVAAAPPAAGPSFPGVARVNTAERHGDWLECGACDATLTDAELAVIIPGGYTGMLERAPALAHAWRMATRDAFTHCFDRGYVAVDFALGEGGSGTYLLRQGSAGA
jgi:predicted GNAT superfamily acetyltransferase